MELLGQAYANPKTIHAHKDSIKSVLKELFAARYEGGTSKMDAYLSKVLETPFIDPTTTVVPVKLAPVEPAETTPSAPVKAATVKSVKKAVAKRPKKKP